MDRRRSATSGLGQGPVADLFPVTRLEEPRSAVLDGRMVPYTLKRSRRRRSIGFVVDEAGLAVLCPWSTPVVHVEHAMQNAARWILRKLDQWAARPARRVLTWQDGDEIEYLGRALVLRVLPDPWMTIAELQEEGSLRVRLRDPAQSSQVRRIVTDWYRRHALRHFDERVRHFAQALGVERPRLLLTGATGRWGSCNAQRQVRLNWRLMQAPAHVVDYVVAHEVAHLVHMNHSSRFWRTVETIFPAYETSRAELAAMSRHYMAL